MEIRDSLRQLLPDSFRVEVELGDKSAFLLVESNSGKPARFELVSAATTAALQKLNLELQKSTKAEDSDSVSRLVVSRYLAGPLRASLRNRNIPFADVTGNIQIYEGRSGLLIITQGSGADPFRKPGRPALSLKSENSQQVAKYLVENKAPIAISKVISETGVSRGSVYRVLDLLGDSGIIRKGSGEILEVDWESLLLKWSDETSFFEAGFTKSYRAPADLQQMLQDLKTVQTKYVATGTIAASHYRQSAGLYAALLYSEDPDALAMELGLTEVSSGANVIIAFPSAPMPYQNEVEIDGLKMTGVALAYRDLWSGPGRGPEEAKNLLGWMRGNLELWQH